MDTGEARVPEDAGLARVLVSGPAATPSPAPGDRPGNGYRSRRLRRAPTSEIAASAPNATSRRPVGLPPWGPPVVDVGGGVIPGVSGARVG